MAYAYALNALVPAPTDNAKLGDDAIRDFKSAMRERVNSFFVDVDADPWVIKAGARAAGPFVIGASDPGGTEDLRVNGSVRVTNVLSVEVALQVQNLLGAADAKNWRLRTNSTDLLFSAVNDAGGAPVDWMFARRGTGTAVSFVQAQVPLIAADNLSIGRAVSTKGGSAYYVDDTGVSKWMTGLGAGAAAKAWVLYDSVNAWTNISVHQTNGQVQFPKGAGVISDQKFALNAGTDTIYVQHLSAGAKVVFRGAAFEFLQTDFQLLIGGTPSHLNIGATNSGGAGQRTVTVDN